jgi:ribose transport system permease protein
MNAVTSSARRPGREGARATSPNGPRRLRRPLRYYLEAYALLGLLIAVAIFFSVWPETADTFPTAANIETLIAANSVVAIVALGALVPLVCYEFDLSVGAIAGLSSIYVATALSDGGGIVAAVFLGIAIGVVVGVVNGTLVTRLGVNAVITTLGMSIIIAGVINFKTEGVGVTGGIPASFTDFGTQTTLGIPRAAFALAAAALAVYYLLNHTPYGRQLYAVGSNRGAAKLVGIRNKLVLGLTFVVAGALCGAAGVLQVARSGGADPRIGDNLTLPALAAAFLSAAAIRPGRYNVGGALVAVYFLAVLNSGLNLTGAEQYVSSFVNGAALIVGVGLAVRLGRRQEL